MLTFSRRLPLRTEANTITRRLDALRSAGEAIEDLTGSNPTTAGIPYPADLLQGLADPAGLDYRPHPLGLAAAREAVARDHLRRGAVVDPRHVVLTASTSEAYAWLFKLLCNPGERVLVPRPSYPLFEHLTRLEGVTAEAYDLEYHRRWEIDMASVAAAPERTRALLAVSPNNPTGSFVSPTEFERLAAIARARGWALVVDEVFADYTLEERSPLADLAGRLDVLTFTLGGCSKSIGLPQVKLGWIVVGGPPAECDAALAALELIADSFLSVGTPVQIAAASLLERGAGVRDAIHARVRRNLSALRAVAARFSACEVLRTEGGWSAVVRVPATLGEDALVLALLEREHVLVHPGYFFDFPREAFIIVSLLPHPDRFAPAVERVLRFAAS